MSGDAEIDEFPPLTHTAVFACQCSSWYPIFKAITFKTTIIRPLDPEFRKYLEADGVFVPEGADDRVPSSELSDDDEEDISDDDDTPKVPTKKYAFPELDDRIRDTITDYGSVFPKLNWTSPQDASWMLAPSSPLKCTNPADVYLFLKSSDFASHDINPDMVFDGCVEEDVSLLEYSLELVLKKWYVMEKSRELRCFVRDDVLLGISQRDPNHYEFLNDDETQASIRSNVQKFWENKIKGRWPGGAHYVFDILLTRNLASAHIVDINPYAARTDALLFTYAELSHLSRDASLDLPELRVITSRAHPAATRTSPQNVHNMIPREALELSAGRNIADFQGEWTEEIRKAMEESSDEERES